MADQPRRRGLDPRLKDLYEVFQDTILVRADVNETIEQLKTQLAVSKQNADLLSTNQSWIRNSQEQLLFVYRLQAHDWTQIDSAEITLGAEATRTLSRQLNTMAFERTWEPVSCSLSYILFDRGEVIEEYSHLSDNPMFQGEQGQEDLRAKLAQGWQISQDHSFMFFSKRGTKIDIESAVECHGLIDRLASELGMYVASLPWEIDAKQHRVELSTGWRPEYFAAAQVLY